MSEKLSYLLCSGVIFVDLTQPGCDSLLHSTDCYWATPETSKIPGLCHIRELQVF